MAKLNQIINYRIKGSTLVEVLISLVLLLTVFAIGMLIVSNLTISEKYQTTHQTKFLLQHVKAVYQEKRWVEGQTLQKDQFVARIETVNIKGFADRQKVKIFVWDRYQNNLIDSLIFIEPLDETTQI